MKKSASRKRVKPVPGNEAAPDDKGKRFLTQELLLEINSGLIGTLVSLAQDGDEYYTYALYHLAWFATMNLQIVVDPKGRFAKKLAPHVTSWPLLVSASPNYLSGVSKLVDSMKLGTQYNGPVDMKRAGLVVTDSRQLALNLVHLIYGMRQMRVFLAVREQYAETMSNAPAGEVRKEYLDELHAKIRQLDRNTDNRLYGR